MRSFYANFGGISRNDAIVCELVHLSAATSHVFFLKKLHSNNFVVKTEEGLVKIEGRSYNMTARMSSSAIAKILNN